MTAEDTGRETYSLSTLRTYAECPRMFYYAHERGLSPRFASMPLREGTLLHDLLESFYTGAFEFGPIVDRWRDQMLALVRANPDKVSYTEEDVEEAATRSRAIIDRYVVKYADDLRRWQILSVEGSFRVRFREPATPSAPRGRPGSWDLVGRTDLVVLDRRSGVVLVIEHKSTSDPNPASVNRGYTMAQQAWGYDFALRQDPEQFGLSPFEKTNGTGFVYNFLRKKLPREPEVTQKGKVSKKMVDTLPEMFAAAIERTGSDPADYVEILEKLTARGDRFLHRTEVYVEPYVSDAWRSDAHAIVSAIRRDRRTGRWFRNTSRCYSIGRPCAFAPVCVDPAGGIDNEEMLAGLFEEKGAGLPLELRDDDLEEAAATRDPFAD